jgi:hypothetical protein
MRTETKRPSSLSLFLIVSVLLISAVVLTEIVSQPIAREFSLLSNTSYFTRSQIEEGRRWARDGQYVIEAIRSYKRKHGSWPDRLNDLVPEFLPLSTDFKRWNYGNTYASGFRATVQGHGGTWLLYFEPDFGWLMATDADTRPITLGQAP